MRAFFAEKSEGRTWWPTNGHEWRILRSGIKYNTAFHVLKVFSGGVWGTVGGRPRATRDSRPRRCHACNTQEVWLTWATPGPREPGRSWCTGCIGAQPHGAPWQWLLARIAPESSLADHGPACLTGDDWHLCRSPYLCCPLCGLGEASSQHLVLWCPAVGVALARCFPDGPRVSLQYTAPGANQDAALPRLAMLIHQVAFLNGTWAGRHVATWQESAGKIYRGMRQPDDTDGTEEWEFTPEDEAGQGLEGAPEDILLLDAASRCTRCSRAAPPAWIGSTAPYRAAHGPHPGDLVRWLPVLRIQ